MVIWAGVIVHVAAHAYRLLDMPESQALTVASAWILVQFGVVFLVFAFHRNLLRPDASGQRLTELDAGLSR